MVIVCKHSDDLRLALPVRRPETGGPRKRERETTGKVRGKLGAAIRDAREQLRCTRDFFGSLSRRTIHAAATSPHLTVFGKISAHEDGAVLNTAAREQHDLRDDRHRAALDKSPRRRTSVAGEPHTTSIACNGARVARRGVLFSDWLVSCGDRLERAT